MGGSVWEIPTHLSVNIFLSPLLHTRAHTCTRQHGWVDMVIILCIGICVCVCVLSMNDTQCWASSSCYTAHMHRVILRHCYKIGFSALLFLPQRLKIETVMLSECTFPPGSVQLWVPHIGWAPPRATASLGYYWPAPVGLCEGKLFWQDQGAQRSCWNWEKDNVSRTWKAVAVESQRECTVSSKHVDWLHRDDHMTYLNIINDFTSVMKSTFSTKFITTIVVEIKIIFIINLYLMVTLNLHFCGDSAP